MTFHKFIIRNSTLLLLLVMAFYSCESNFKEVQKQNFSEFAPSGEADDFNMKYTDSGRIKSILISPKMLDYASVTFPFTEFPKGINVTLFDLNNKETSSNITCKYNYFETFSQHFSVLFTEIPLDFWLKDQYKNFNTFASGLL